MRRARPSSPPAPLRRGRPAPRRARPVLLLAGLLVAGCQDQNLFQQKRLDTYAASRIWPDGTSARPLPEGAVAQGDLARDAALAAPPEVTPALLGLGRDRYDVFCSPCHGYDGDGHGMIVQRGFPPPPSYHSERLRAAPASHFVDVITRGYGVMYAYAARVPPAERWAVAAYIRALQLSHHATLAEAPEAAGRLR
ncbi:c-type cytochrome [Methylobacterium sp. WSM2598]|uniref:c-type cytochrome n=1 Tax=Methylobacterium sp. WSM2598 TaxID=398261 RepID=UPI0003672B11|nr:cytochrome c [Methylobacterium sp. WSM2598]